MAGLGWFKLMEIKVATAVFPVDNTYNLLSLRLFQHTELEHTPKPLPTGYKGIPFIVG